MFTSEQLEARAKDRRELIRSREIVERNKARVFKRINDGAIAEVAGSGKTAYSVEFSDDLTGKCSCMSFRGSKSRWCKHLTAIGMLVLLEVEGEVLGPESLDPELALAMSAMSHEEVRELLFAASGRFSQIRDRIMTGDWGMD